MQAFDADALEPCHLFARKYGYRGPRVISTVHQGRRVRAVGSQLFFRPESETFSEFKYYYLKQLLGKNWWTEESKKPQSEMHAIMRCAVDLHGAAKRAAPPDHKPGQLFRYQANSALNELLQLADDVLRLAAAGATPPASVLDRLRSRPEFHSARYEVMAAAMLVRCGFKADWLDPKLKAGEFKATDPLTSEAIHVEAKSRNRPGTLHEPGSRPAEEDLTADLDRLLKSALDQCRPENANAIFIEANLPSGSDEAGNWPYWETVTQFIGRVPKRIERKGTFNAFLVCVTANGWHWRPNAKVEGIPTAHAFLSPCNTLPSNPNTLIRFLAGIAYPPTLPESVYE